MDDGIIKDEFEITPKMSTYLVAFHLSDLTVTQNLDDKSYPKIRFSTRNEYINMTK
jgi:hypothetical protein